MNGVQREATTTSNTVDASSSKDLLTEQSNRYAEGSQD